MLQLADHRNIAGLKDCCGDRNQSLDLLHRRPENFAVLTGEDAQYHEALIDGADGDILASAHIETETFAGIEKLAAAGRRDAQLSPSRPVPALAPLVVSEPSPSPIKSVVFRTDLIT